MSIIMDAFKFLFTDNAQAVTAKNHHENAVLGIDLLPDDNGRKVNYVHKGEIHEVVVPPPLRTHQVDSVADLIAAGKRWGSKGTIWIKPGYVCLMLDDEDRREHVNLHLTQTGIFQQLVKLTTANRMDQASLVKLLRRDFREALGAGTMLSAVRKIKFRQYTDGNSTIQHGNESMGRSIESEVAGIDESIPEGIVVSTPVYINPGEEQCIAQISLDLELLVSEQKFILRPMPDQVEAAMAYALADIRERIEDGLKTKEGQFPVFYGTP